MMKLRREQQSTQSIQKVRKESYCFNLNINSSAVNDFRSFRVSAKVYVCRSDARTILNFCRTKSESVGMANFFLYRYTYIPKYYIIRLKHILALGTISSPRTMIVLIIQWFLIMTRLGLGFAAECEQRSPQVKSMRVDRVTPLHRAHYTCVQN